MPESEEPTVEVTVQLLVWLAVCGLLLFPALGYVMGYRSATEDRCEEDCEGQMHSCEDGDCICEGPDGSLYRAPGWEPDR